IDVDPGEVEGEHEVAAALGRRVSVHPEPAEELVELVLAGEVVVVLQHAQQGGLAEAPGAKEQGGADRGALQEREAGRLVDVEEALAPDFFEVGATVRDLHGASLAAGSYHRGHGRPRTSAARGSPYAFVGVR